MKEPLSNQITLLMSSTELSVVDRIADEKYLSRGAFIRSCIREGIKKHKGETQT